MDALTKLHSSGMPPSYVPVGCLRDVERFDIVADVSAMSPDEVVSLQHGWYIVCNCSSIPVVFSPIGSTL
jgi:hypothetical protein